MPRHPRAMPSHRSAPCLASATERVYPVAGGLTRPLFMLPMGIVKLTPKIARLYSKERTIESFGLSRAPVFSPFPALQLSSRERCLRRFFINLTMPAHGRRLSLTSGARDAFLRTVFQRSQGAMMTQTLHACHDAQSTPHTPQCSPNMLVGERRMWSQKRRL
jgi:hypothetical protein